MTPEAQPETVVMDFPDAWEYVRTTDTKDHHERCSWRTEHGAFLCDCSVIWKEYGRREARSDLADTFCFLRRHDNHPEQRHCAASWDEADRIVRCLAALHESRRNRQP